MFEVELERRAAETPDAVAVSTAADNVTYAELNGDANRLARGFQELGLERELTAVRIENPVLHWVVLLALVKLRIPSCSIVPRGQDEAEELRALGPALVLGDRAFGPEAGRSVFLSPAWFAAALQGPPDPVDCGPYEPDDAVRVATSSGTTGVPKRMLFTRGLIDVRYANLEAAIDQAFWDRPHRVLIALGVDVLAGFTGPLACWRRGYAVVYPPPAFVWPRFLQESGVTAMGATPIQLERLVETLPPDFEPRPQLRIDLGGSMLSQALSQRARARLTPDIQVVYGSTEAGLTAFMPATEAEGRPGAVGRPVASAEVEIVDGQGRRLGPGQLGEIRIRSSSMVNGYLDQDRDEAAFRDGWFHPGDLGSLEPDGVLTVHGRVDEVMNLGGVKVAPALVEEALLFCPGVRDAAAFAVPLPDGRVQPFAAVVVGQGFHAEVARSALRRACPVEFTLVHIAEVPRNRLGKIERGVLRRMVEARVSERPAAPAALAPGAA